MSGKRVVRLAVPVLLLSAACREGARPSATPPSTSPPAEAPASLPPDHGAAPPGDLPPGHPPVAAAPAHGAAPDSESVAGTVDVAPDLKSRIQGGALFLIARNAKTRQIVAVRREESVPLPMPFKLSGNDAMTQGIAFEGPLDVTARWSARGDAMPAPGDIEGTARGVDVGARQITLTLSEVRE